MTSAEWKLIGIGAALSLTLGAYFTWRQEERHKGAIAVILHQTDSTVKVLQKGLDSASQAAQEAETARQAALTKASQELGRQRADSAKQDSIVRASANERQKAEQVARDSAAGAQALRLSLESLIAASRADSAVYHQSLEQAHQTISSLIRVVAADSLTIQAERTRAGRAEQLAALKGREADLLRKAQPSVAGTVVKDALWLAAGVGIGLVVK